MFILIMGVAGSGKTTIGSLLSSHLGWPFYDADDFHSPENVRKMAAGAPLTDEDRTPWLRDLRKLIDANGDGVLACSALKEAYRGVLSSDADVVVVYLRADRDVVRSRLESRKGHYMPQSLIDSQFLALEEPTDSIVIDAALPPEQAVSVIRSQLAR